MSEKITKEELKTNLNTMMQRINDMVDGLKDYFDATHKGFVTQDEFGQKVEELKKTIGDYHEAVKGKLAAHESALDNLQMYVETNFVSKEKLKRVFEE